MERFDAKGTTINMIQNPDTNHKSQMGGESNANESAFTAGVGLTFDDGFTAGDGLTADASSAKSELPPALEDAREDASVTIVTSVKGATADSDATPRDTAEPPLQTLSRPLRNLRELGLTKETLKRFKIDHAYGVGFVFPVSDINGEPLQLRVYATSAKLSGVHWANSKLCSAQAPPFYNLEALKSAPLRPDGLFIVPQEVHVWTMEQNNLSAISCIGNSDYVRLAALLEEQGIQSVIAIFEHTFEGRCQALAMHDAMDGKINVKILFLEGTFGGSISELFEWVGFSDEKFRDELAMLPSFSPILYRLWKQKPESMREGLPDAEEDGLLQCLDENELAQLPRPQCLIEDMLLAKGYTLLTGTHASGKSFVALSMGLCISQGQKWHGKGTQAGAVFYFSGEGTEGLRSRIDAWKQTHSVVALPNFAVVNGGVGLVDPVVRRRAIDTVRARLQRMNLAPDGAALLVFDTLERYRGALKENDSDDMGQLADALEEIGRELGAAVVVVHHNNRDGSYRGSSVLPSKASGHLELSNPPSKGQGKGQGQKIKIRVAKLKDFAQGHSLTLGSQVVEIGGVDEFGKPLSSLVLTLDSGPQTNGDGLSLKETDALQALIELGSPGATSGVWKKAAFDKKKVSSTTFDRAKSKLVELGAVTCDNPGVSGALHKAVEGWAALPAENGSKDEDDTQDDAENDNGNPGTPYHYQLREGDPEVDEWNPVGEWIIRYRN